MFSALPFLILLSTSSPPPIPYTMEMIDGKKHKIFLTVDDHPCRHTSTMLKILKAHKIRATFFVNSWGLRVYYRYPQHQLYKKYYDRMVSIHRHGHLLGNHSVTHRFLCKLSPSVLRWEINETQRLVKKATGVTMQWWRPPHGIWCRKLYREVQRAGLKSLMWHVADYKKSAGYMYWRTRLRVRRKHSSTIVLFHCAPNKLRRFLHLLRPH